MEHRRCPQRQHLLPAYLEDSDVGLQPSVRPTLPANLLPAPAATEADHLARVHLFIYPSVLSLGQFITGTASKILCDDGTNFIGGEQKLREAFHAMAAVGPAGKTNLIFNPTSAPHFIHVWEQDVHSVKMALRVTLRELSAPEPGLHTVLTDVEEILNAKSLRSTPSSGVDGYVRTSTVKVKDKTYV